MGNCLKRPSSEGFATDDDEDWDWECSPAKEGGDFPAKDVVGGGGKATTEVKIKITKKQLEALLQKVDVKAVGVEGVLAQLVSHSDRSHRQQRPWRPALQSIPEFN